jgi:hypothetical protein
MHHVLSPEVATARRMRETLMIIKGAAPGGGRRSEGRSRA